MSDADRRAWPVRKRRLGAPEPDDVAHLTAAERVAMVWPLTLAPGPSRMTPPLPTDFREMLSALSDAGAEYLVVDAHAMAAHGLPRATGDLDVWVRAEPANAERVLRALATFGVPMAGLAVDDFVTPDRIIQLGVAPYRIDFLTSIDGVTFEEAWPAREEVALNGLRVPIIGREHLIQNKRATDRPQDRADVERLERGR